MHRILLLFIVISFFCTGYVRETSYSEPGNGIVEYSSRVVLEDTYTFTSTLKFNRVSSIFFWRLNNGTKVSSGSNGGATVSVPLDDEIGHVTKLKISADSIYSRLILDKLYLLKEKRPKIDWHITNQHKKIGNYSCTKATANFRGRSYTAWFTPEIPTPFGPWKLTGLPGLILEAYDTDKEIYFSARKLVLNREVEVEEIPLSGKEELITLKEYREITANVGERLAQKLMKAVSKMEADIKVSNISAPKLIETFEEKDS